MKMFVTFFLRVLFHISHSDVCSLWDWVLCIWCEAGIKISFHMDIPIDSYHLLNRPTFPTVLQCHLCHKSGDHMCGPVFKFSLSGELFKNTDDLDWFNGDFWYWNLNPVFFEFSRLLQSQCLTKVENHRSRFSNGDGNGVSHATTIWGHLLEGEQCFKLPPYQHQCENH